MVIDTLLVLTTKQNVSSHVNIIDFSQIYTHPTLRIKALFSVNDFVFFLEMSSTTIFSSLRRRMSPTLETFLPPVDLDFNVTRLLDNLTSISSDLISSFSGQPPTFQKHNSKTLLCNIQLFTVVLDSVQDSTSKLPSTAITCFKELYLLLHRSKILLDYCTQSSNIWLLLHNQSISGHFYDLNHDISTL